MSEPQDPFVEFEDEMMTCWFCLKARPYLDQCEDLEPDQCLGRLDNVDAACCGHGFFVPYVRFTDGRPELDRGDALDYFNSIGRGPKVSDLYRHVGDYEYRLIRRQEMEARMQRKIFETNHIFNNALEPE